MVKGFRLCFEGSFVYRLWLEQKTLLVWSTRLLLSLVLHLQHDFLIAWSFQRESDSLLML